MIRATAFPIYDDGRSGDVFAEATAPDSRRALRDLSFGPGRVTDWEPAEQDPEVVRIEVTLESVE